jgi:proline racemase
MRWTKALNVVECHVGGEVAKVMTGGVVAAIALVIARAANILG